MRWRLLLSAARRARATGGRLVVAHGPGTIQRLFEIVDVTLELELVDRPISPPAATVLAPGGRLTFAKADAEAQLGAMPKERVRIDKDVVTDEQQASETLREEQIEAEGAPPL
jgi:Domain of unknown function (DUF2382)